MWCVSPVFKLARFVKAAALHKEADGSSFTEPSVLGTDVFYFSLFCNSGTAWRLHEIVSPGFAQTF